MRPCVSRTRPQVAAFDLYYRLEVAAMWISAEDKKRRTKGLRNAGVAFAMAKRGGPMKNPRDKRREQKERRFEEQAG